MAGFGAGFAFLAILGGFASSDPKADVRGMRDASQCQI